MKLEVPIIVGFDDMESLLDDLKKLQTYKCFEGAEEVLVDIEDVAKVLMDHVKAKKSVKGDLISRKAVYDALECMRFESDKERRYGFSLLEQIPTAQPEVETQMSLADCISRQAAIAEFSCCELTPDGGIDANYAIDFLKQLPSAQTKIIRCKDCKHYQFANNRAFGMPVKMCEWFGFEDVDDYGFCSRAERRTDE